MKLKVLGCSGSEFPGFYPPAFLLDDRILMDAGTTTFIMDQKAQEKVTHILITHTHLDHIRGIASLADNRLLMKPRREITLVGTRTVLQAIKKNIFNNMIWPDFTELPNRKNPMLRLKYIRTGRSFKIYNYRITAEKVHHSVPGVGYIIEGPKNKKIIYTGDTGPTYSLWKRANVLSRNGKINGAIVEVTFPNSMKDAAIRTGHLTPSMLNAEMKKLVKLPGKIFVTHPKPQFF